MKSAWQFMWRRIHDLKCEEIHLHPPGPQDDVAMRRQMIDVIDLHSAAHDYLFPNRHL